MNWWSTDALAEKYPNISSYVYCAGNPVKYVDPDGKDLVHVNDKGSVVRVTLNNSPTIQVVYPDGHQVVLSSIDISGNFLGPWNNDNRQIVANIVGYYGGLAGVNDIHAGATTDDEALASTDHWNNIWVQPTSNGGISNQLNNKYDLMSVLIHEQYHQKESKDGEYIYTKHASVYLKQAQHSTFNRTSKKFAEGQMGNLIRYLTAAKSKAEQNDNEKGYKDIIKQFNDSNIRGGYQIVDRESGGMQLLNPKGKAVTTSIKPLSSPQ